MAALIYDSKDKQLCFVADVFFFFSTRILEVPRPIADILSHVLGSECNLRNWVRNLGPSP